MLTQWLLTAALAAQVGLAPDPRALAVVDTAVARMGGAALLGIERVRYEMITQWQRTTFRARPGSDLPSYELHSDLRDYSLPAWRNTRHYPASATERRTVTDLVRADAAVRDAGRGWAPLNVAYVDEMRELFTFSPERVVRLAREAGDLRLLSDTTIDGLPHARVAGTVGGFPATLVFRRADGLPALARYRAAQPNDFGLTAWGEMEVEVWYANWRPFPGGLTLPAQWDVHRAGRPYKRMSVISAAFGLAATPDSFAIGDSLRAAYAATAARPMHDLPLDSARILEGRFASFGAFGSPAGAVRLGGKWLLLEAGVAPLSLERARDWLRSADPAADVAGALVTVPSAGNGGVVTLAAERLPVYVGEGAAPFVRTMLANAGVRGAVLEGVGKGRWLTVGGDSVRLETLDLPNAPGLAVAYVPSLRWMYVSMAATPLDLRLALAHAKRRGWTVERIGTARAVVRPVPAV